MNMADKEPRAQARYLGQTGEDFVGAQGSEKPSGIKDEHILLTDLAGPLKKVTVDGDQTQCWEWPFNGVNWIIMVKQDNDKADLFFEPCGSKSYRVHLTYSDDSTYTPPDVPFPLARGPAVPQAPILQAPVQGGAKGEAQSGWLVGGQEQSGPRPGQGASVTWPKTQ